MGFLPSCSAGKKGSLNTCAPHKAGQKVGLLVTGLSSSSEIKLRSLQLHAVRLWTDLLRVLNTFIYCWLLWVLLSGSSRFFSGQVTDAAHSLGLGNLEYGWKVYRKNPHSSSPPRFLRGTFAPAAAPSTHVVLKGTHLKGY